MATEVSEEKDQAIDAAFEAALDELFADPPSPEQIVDYRERNPELAALVDAFRDDFEAKGTK